MKQIFKKAIITSMILFLFAVPSGAETISSGTATIFGLIKTKETNQPVPKVGVKAFRYHCGIPAPADPPDAYYVTDEDGVYQFCLPPEGFWIIYPIPTPEHPEFRALCKEGSWCADKAPADRPHYELIDLNKPCVNPPIPNPIP